MTQSFDTVIGGAGLAGLVAANELVARGKTVTILPKGIIVYSVSLGD